MPQVRLGILSVMIMAVKGIMASILDEFIFA